MKRTLSLMLALALVFVCVFSFAACGTNIKGTYKDANGSVWTFSGSKLEIEGTFTINKTDHKVTAVYDTSLETNDKGVETLTLVIKKYVYEGDNEVAKETVAQANIKLDTDTDVEKTTEYTFKQDSEKITLTKSSVTTTLTRVQ